MVMAATEGFIPEWNGENESALFQWRREWEREEGGGGSGGCIKSRDWRLSF